MGKSNFPGWLAQKILETLKAYPDGLDIYKLREKIPEAKEGQEQFGRRLRDLDPFYIIESTRRGRMTVYKYIKPRPDGEWQFQKIDKTQRARIIHKSNGRCQMCGSTIADDDIKLHVDHKIPESWGGETTDENLWAICSVCNEGKKNYFASFDSRIMTQIMGFKSVHERIARLLKLKEGEWVNTDLIDFVANAIGSQTDWRKRLRELRYLGLNIKSKRIYSAKRATSQYKLIEWVDLPENPSSAARKYEFERAIRNKMKLGNNK